MPFSGHNYPCTAKLGLTEAVHSVLYPRGSLYRVAWKVIALKILAYGVGELPAGCDYLQSNHQYHLDNVESWDHNSNRLIFSTERPFHLAIGTFFLCGIILFVSDWYCGKIFEGLGGLSRRKHDAIKTGESSLPSGRWSRFLSTENRTTGTVALQIVLRVILIRWIRSSVQYSWNGVEIFLPFCLLVLQSMRKNSKWPAANLELKSKVIETNHTRPFIFLAFWTVSALTITWLSNHRSTYICPIADNWRRLIGLFQCIGLVFDAFIISNISRIAQEPEGTSRWSWKYLCKIALLSGTLLVLIVSIFLSRNSEHIPWAFNLDRRTCTQLIFAIILCTNWIGCFFYLLHEVRHVTLVTILGCLSLFVYQSSRWPFQFSDAAGYRGFLLTAACLVIYACMVGLVRIERDATRSQIHLAFNRASIRILTGLTLIVGAALFSSALILHFRFRAWGGHPINLLMVIANSESETWTAQAGASKSLSEAVLSYQTRYGIHPPPNFDKWYNFAIERNSTIIDNFDKIHNDLLPFWGMEPAEIRRLTGHMLARPWTEVAGIRISNGTASIGPHMPGTHRWMLDGTLDMVNKFVQYLPDMDLAFNLNDESRVAVPWAELKKYKLKAMATRSELNRTKAKVTSFYPHMIDVWEGSFMQSEAPHGPDDPSDLFEAASLRSSFDHYGTIGCPPDSLARQTQWSNEKSICHHCLAQHTLNSFVSNWTLSGSLCHQPDLTNLHGFHLSPSAFKTTNTLLPIFSQSKVPTFNDIIFPSPWNYRDKVVHDPYKDMPFSEKENTVFWRGATSEGFSLGGTWMGMQRQRFVHLVNNIPNNTLTNLLLPTHISSSSLTRHALQAVPLQAIKSQTKFSVSFVGSPVRSDHIDSLAQSHNFHFEERGIEFQEHWRYKYLFDLDGAGFSGRFLPFLQSNSLVFRAATFRQWFDERLIAWKHFVPVDTRLHDVWGLVAYFGGVEGKIERHEKEAEEIATQGKEWAGKVLRKEDMEVYMFRLLLEWGRIVDDARTGMGFVMPGVS